MTQWKSGQPFIQKDGWCNCSKLLKPNRPSSIKSGSDHCVTLYFAKELKQMSPNHRFNDLDLEAQNKSDAYEQNKQLGHLLRSHYISLDIT